MGVQFELQGLENIDEKRGGVVVLNHQTDLDMISELSHIFALYVIRVIRLTFEQSMKNYRYILYNIYSVSEYLALYWSVFSRLQERIFLLFPPRNCVMASRIYFR